MKKILSIAVLFALTVAAMAQQSLSGKYYQAENNIELVLNIEAPNIPVPGLELDSCYGYMRGSLNGAWIVLKVKQNKGKSALIRTMSERGADAQDLEITEGKEPGTIVVRQTGGVAIKGVSSNKYVKLPKDIIFKKKAN